MLRLAFLLTMISSAGPIFAQNNQEIPDNHTQQQNKVFIFTQTYCPACIHAKQYMSEHKIEYVELDIETSPEALSAFERIKGRGVPLLIINKQMSYGFDPKFINAQLYK